MESQSLCRGRSPGYFPQYGAIFMANKSTRNECFERELFGLPRDYADFVMEVKTGMLLFLFDFQERKLYGVFEAASEGAINIIPDAYSSISQRKFPAQVRFSILWHCDPLPEHAFRDAIKDNYYAPFKFNFGLSRDQVGRLLSLFKKKMLKIPRSPVRGRHHRSSQIEKSVVVAHPDSLESSEAITESMQESISEMLDTLDCLDHGSAARLEDYIPLPSIEPEEIEDSSDVFLWSAMSFDEVGECLLKPVIWPSGDHSSKGAEDSSKLASYPSGHTSITEDHEEIDDSSGIQVRGLYSDSSKDRTSVFLRLSWSGKVKVEERHCQSKVDDVRDILKGLDKRSQLWKHKRSSVNESKSKGSVFSRLASNVGNAEFSHHNLKRKNSCSAKTEDKGCDRFPSKQQKKRLRKHSGKYIRVTKNSNLLPDVSDFSDGNSVSMINS